MFSNLEFFKKDKQNLDCIKCMNFTKLKQNDIVFKYGEIGDKFYVLLKGKVAVKVPNEIKMKCAYEEYMTYLKNNIDDILFEKMNITEDEVLAHKPPKLILSSDREIKEYSITQLVQVLEYNKGQSFGELALMNKKPRAATIV